MNDINVWLHNKDYQVGVKLYCKYGSNDFLKKVLSLGDTDYTRQKLEDELTSLYESYASKVGKDKAISHTAYSEPSPHQASVQYLKLCRYRDELNRQISRNMVLLDETRSKPRRFETAKQIISLHRKKVRIWAEIDYYMENGTMMPVAVKTEPKTDELQRLYVQINKAEKRLLQPELRNREKTEKLLNEKRKRVDEIRMERGAKP